MTRKKLKPLHEGEKPFYAGERGSRENVHDDEDASKKEATAFTPFDREKAGRAIAELDIPRAAQQSEKGPEDFIG